MSTLVQGLILSRSGTQVVVEIDGEELPPIGLARHLHATGQADAGDACLVGTVRGARVVVAVLGTTSAPAPVPVPPAEDVSAKAPPTGSTGSSPVSPVWSGSWRGGSWRPDTNVLYQGDYTGRGVQTGAAYYGAGLRAWPHMAGLQTRLRRITASGVNADQRPTMALLAGDTRPGGYPTILATAPGPLLGWGDAEDWQWPSGWVGQVLSGAAGGLGITSGGSRTPYVALSAAGDGMTTTVDWRAE